MIRTVFRLAAWDTPWWVNPNRNPGRFNRVGQTTQYLCMHPLGPWAEFVRREGIENLDDLAFSRHRIWAARIDLTDAVEITWDNAKSEFDIEPDALVSDEHSTCQNLGDLLRAKDVSTLIVPSAALPGTRNVVLFGPRVIAPYEPDPIDPTLDVPTSVVADHGHVDLERLSSLCRLGGIHEGLRSWRAGRPEPQI